MDLSSLAWPGEDTRAGWLNKFDILLRTYGVGRKVNSWPQEAVALSAAKAAVEWLGDPAEEPISRERAERSEQRRPRVRDGLGYTEDPQRSVAERLELEAQSVELGLEAPRFGE